jgi:hypothetical protein
MKRKIVRKIYGPVKEGKRLDNNKRQGDKGGNTRARQGVGGEV